MRRNRLWLGCLLTVAALAGLDGVGVSASPLNIDTGKTLTIQPGGSGTLTLSLTNLNSGTAISTFNAWSMGLQLLPRAGATGSATIVSAALPATNAALADPEDPPLFSPGETLSVPANGSTVYTLVASGNKTAAETTFSLGQQYNVADLAISLSGDASGAWDLYAVNNANGIAAWTSAPPVVTSSYGNLPQADGNTGSLLVGTVSAVPEPGGFLLAGTGLAAAGWFAWRSRRSAVSGGA